MKRVLPNEKVKMFLLKFPHIQASHFKDFEQWTTIDHSDYQVQKLPKAQRTQGIQCFDSINIFCLVKLKLGFVWQRARIT